MAKFTIVEGHPDPSEERLNRALADRYARAAAAAGHEVRRIDVARIDFPMLRSQFEFLSDQIPDEIRQAQRDIAWADHVTFFYPLWMGDVPALFKAFIEQTFRPGFALEYGGKGFPRGLLAGRTARIVVTMGMPAFVYRTYFRSHTLENLRINLQMCGFAPVRTTVIGGVGEPGQRKKRLGSWLNRMECLAPRDALPERKHNVAGSALLTTGFLAAGAYLSYVALTWLRFESFGRTSRLIDQVMPDYDVRLHHKTTIGAPAEIAFGAMDHTDVERSPIVQALFRAREILMRARHAERTLPHGLLAQFEAFGWTIVAQEPGREYVFGAITEPWKANPAFHGLPREEFRRFRDPGYAKIAFTLRVDPLDPNTSIAQTETRVQVTDAVSRARFRRYWSFLSPGMELIRIVLLQQLKAAAESPAPYLAT
jgi:putative NADPH-quinone reductase